MAKIKSVIPKQEPESMIDQKTYEDFNKEKPDPSDPNFKDPSEINQDKPPSKSGKGLKQSITKMFVCVKHLDVITTKPGKCPICGLVLMEKK